MSGELFGDDGGCHHVYNQKSLRHTQSEKVLRRRLGYELLIEKKRKNKEPKTCLDVWLRVIKGYV